jgi:hypothetical protein
VAKELGDSETVNTESLAQESYAIDIEELEEGDSYEESFYFDELEKCEGEGESEIALDAINEPGTVIVNRNSVTINGKQYTPSEFEEKF